MANSTQDLPPFIRLATIKGVVVTRRSTRGLYVGRALETLNQAKRSTLVQEPERLEWTKVKNNCVVA